MTTRTLAIIGASLAGAKAAEGAREAGYDGRVVLIGDESALPYERPPLSKKFLRGEAEADEATVQSGEFYKEHDIELLKAEVVSLDTEQRRVELADGDAITFDTAVLATGAAPRRLDVEGAQLEGIHYLRTVDDSVRLRDAIRRAERVAVVGAGWIGSEVAASAKQMGADVVVIEPLPVPLQRVLGDDIGRVFAKLHADNGVRLRLGTGVRALRGTKAVNEVVLEDGSRERADVVVVGVGVAPRVAPRVALAEAAGLKVDNGVVVDEYLETSAQGIYAAGDVANAHHPHYGRSIRVEHWANALNQGLAAGRNAGGKNDRYDRLPYFFSDQYDLGMEYVGYAEQGDALAVRGDLDSREFIAFWHRGGYVTAATNVNIWDVTDEFKRIIASRRQVDLGQLTDPGVPLSALAT
jgi:3-phenylpropionate/trans-cinnamate dioxygenase ferredoxin reductase subunit